MKTIQHNGSTREFYSVVEVSEMFGISKKSVYRLLHRGLLKTSKALRHKMVPRASVNNFIANSVQNGGVQ